jgi:hypothetical protein
MCRLAALRDPVPTRATRGVRGDHGGSSQARARARDADRRRDGGTGDAVAVALARRRRPDSLDRASSSSVRLGAARARCPTRDWDSHPYPAGDVLVDRLQRALGPMEPETNCRREPRELPRQGHRDRRAPLLQCVLRRPESRAAGLVDEARSLRQARALLSSAEQIPRIQCPTSHARPMSYPTAARSSSRRADMGRSSSAACRASRRGSVENGTAAGLDARCAFRYVPPPFVLR